MSLQASANVERVASGLFSESKSGGAKPAEHTSRRQLLAAGIVLISTRINAFDRTATPEVSMLGIGARLTLAFWRQAICEMADPTRTEVTRTRTVMTCIIDFPARPGVAGGGNQGGGRSLLTRGPANSTDLPEVSRKKPPPFTIKVKSEISPQSELRSVKLYSKD